MKKHTWVELGVIVTAIGAALATSASASASDVVDCEVVRAKGVFSSYIPPRVGDKLMVDLAEGPRGGQLRFRREPDDNNQLRMSYIPLSQPWRNESGYGRSRWVSGNGPGALAFEVTADNGDGVAILISRRRSDEPEGSRLSLLELRCER